MTLRNMNIDRKMILAGASKVSAKRKIGYYRWIIRVCKASAE